MDKDTYVLSFMGRSTIGKSRIISTCIADGEIASHMHKDNVSGKTKTNMVYIINNNEQNSFKLVPKIEAITKEFLNQTEEDTKFKVKEFKKYFSDISKTEDLDGLERFANHVVNMDELKEWLNGYFNKVEIQLLELLSFNNSKDVNQQIMFYSKLFEEELSYNKLFDIEIELKASDKFKKILEKYGLKRIILIDSRGVFDETDKFKRSFARYVPDINVFIFEDKGMTEYLFNQIYEELKPMFGKSFEICIRTATDLNAQVSTVDNCLNPTQNEILAKKFETSIKFLKEKNILDGDTVFDMRLREQLGSVLPEIPTKDEYGLTDEQVEDCNAKYDDIICGIFNKVIGLKQQEEKAIATIREKCKNPTYKDALVGSVIYGNQYSIWEKYAKRCSDAVDGNSAVLKPRPQADTIRYHIKNMFFNNYPTSWGREQYISNIVTYEAANLMTDAITEIRENREKFSDEELSEYIFILKNTLGACEESLYNWESYVFFNSEGYRAIRIPNEYYYRACRDTVNFSKGGNSYYTIYDKLGRSKFTRAHKSALLHCITSAVSGLLQDKLQIDKIILEDQEIA